MLKIFLSIVFVFILSATIAQIGVISKNPSVVTGKLIRTTKALRDFKLSDKAIPDVKVRDEDGIIGKDEAFEEGEEREMFTPTRVFNEDPALQKIYPNNPHLQKQLSRAITANFNGMPYQPLNPPDPSLCVGPNHVIQMINGSSGALFKVYNKSGGQLVAQTYLDAITGKGGLGDPIALYDQFADRFILTEFANKPETGTEGLIFAVSQTGDPAGSWYVYFFSTGTTFPDYPKFSIWTDAYYGTTNDFANGSSYSGSSVYAFDKSKMLAGNPTATVQKFTPGSTSKFFSMCPVSIEGTSVPPIGTGGLIAYMLDDAWTLAADVDSIGLLEFKVDFTTPANSNLSTKSSLATLPFKSDICSATRGQCIAQPVSITKVEALHQKIMNKPIYRKFGGYEGIVITHVVDKGSNISGVRWYELRKTTGNWGIYQQSTYAPDNTHRWMPGIGYDKNGNIALAYNVSSSSGIYPGAKYTGRKECDALNSMTYSEDVIINGTASNTSTRYGDYNELVCDPFDGLTFWFTCEYNASSTWSTRIASFTLDPCSAPVCGDPTSLTTSAITNTSATLGWTAGSGDLTYDVDYKLSSSGTWLNVATATTSTAVNLSGLTQGSTYDWRVKATCASGTGNYVASQFTTTLPVVCNPPSGLNSSSISNTSENVSWTGVSGATSYDVEYKLTTDINYSNAATAITTTSTNISGLTAGTQYDWRVKATCSGTAGNYSSAQFTTSSTPVCNVPTNLSASSITTNSATVNWLADINALNDVDYKASSSGTWSPVVSGTTATSVPISGLTASTLYDWRVISHCSGANSSYAQSQFTTNANCPADQLEPNNLFQTAASISVNTDYYASIPVSTDQDYYSFSTSGAQKNVQVTLTNLTVNFDLQLLDANGSILGTSQSTGTTETVVFNNKKPASYKVRVYSTGGAASTQCYILRVTTGSSTFSPSGLEENIATRIIKGGLKVYPIPATTSVTISFDSYHNGLSDIIVSNQLGQEVFSKKMNVIEGNNSTVMNVNSFRPGVYFIKVYNGKTVEIHKMVINNK